MLCGLWMSWNHMQNWMCVCVFSLFIFLNVFVFNWRIGFYQISTWNSHRFTHGPSHLNIPKNVFFFFFFFPKNVFKHVHISGKSWFRGFISFKELEKDLMSSVGNHLHLALITVLVYMLNDILNIYFSTLRQALFPLCSILNL